MLLGTGILQAAAADSGETGQAQVGHLMTNGVADPEAVDPGSPVFSWQVSDPERGFLQTACQVVVTEKLSGKEVWDSGRVETGDSASFQYAGPALAQDRSYTWKVRVWDQEGQESPYSEPGMFRVGLDQAGWTADYIWDGTENQNDFAYFRKSFEVGKEVAEAVVYTSAHNDYQLTLNGEQVGVGPARSDPYTYGQYCAYDVTGQLRQGQNAFAALAHWHGAWSDSGVNARPAYILEARIRYTDGTSQIVKTDAGWKVAATTPYVEENPVYFGFYGGVNNRASIQYDARREIPGWNASAFDDSGWQDAAVVDRQDYNLYAQLVAEQEEMESQPPVSVTRQGDKWIVDFGKCLTGWPELKLHGNSSGDQVKVQYWEVQQGWGDAGYDSYTCRGGEETFKTPYVRHTSFRLLEITGYSGELTADDVRGIVAYSYADKQGSFRSSDDRLNAVYEMCERSGRQNVQQGIISVDANREQSPWTADSWNIGIGCLYNHQDTMLIDKIIKDYAGEQLGSGNFLTCSPARDYNSEMAEWSLYWPMLLWEQYLFSGNEALLVSNYPNLTKFLAYMQRYQNPGTGLYNPPGWRASDYAGGSLENGGENIATNCQLYQNFVIAASVSRQIGEEENAQRYEQAAASLKQAVNRNLLVDGEKYRTTPGSGQTHPLGTAWALRSGIVPNAFLERVTTWFAKQKKNYDVGGYGGDALYSGLYEAGLGKVATEDFARYDTMLSTNNTNWESFGALSNDNMGNHAWTAYPSYLLPKYAGGVQPTSGGFATVDIKPVTGGLSWAETTVPTAKGKISVRWEAFDKQHLRMDVTIPANTTAQIFVPDNDMTGLAVTEQGRAVFENGSFAAGAPGLTQGGISDGYIVFTAGSGTYSFEVTGTPLNTPDIGTEEPESGIILDDAQAVYEGNWVYETASNLNDRYGDGFHYSPWTSGQPTASAVYTATVEQAGKYDVFAWWGTHPNRATDTPYTIEYGETSDTVRVNQEENGGKWNELGSYELQAGETVSVTITNDANEYVIADAVRIAPHEDAGEDTLTALQQLQLLVYKMELVDTSNCTRPSFIEEFAAALAAAQQLCAASEPDEQEALKALGDLNAAYEGMQAFQRDNLALNRPVSASEGVRAPGLWGEEYLTDGYKALDNSGRIGYTTNDYHTPDLEQPIDLTIDLGSVQTLNQVVLSPRLSARSWEGKTANFPRDYEVQLSTDGREYRTVRQVTGQADPELNPVSIEFERTQAQFVRIHVTKLGEYAGDEGLPDNPTPYRLQLSEIEVFNQIRFYQVSAVYNQDGGEVTGRLGEYEEGSQITLTARPNDGWSFRGWFHGATLLGTQPEITLTVESDLALSAVFEQTVPPEVQADKTVLQKVIAYAQEAVQSGEYAGAIAQVQASLRAALENAQAVSRSETASQAEVDSAWIGLLHEIHKLGFQRGDASQLAFVLFQANEIDLDAYVSEGQQAFIQALEGASALDVSNALQAEIDQAVDKLVTAMLSLRYRADKSVLESLLRQAGQIDLSAYSGETGSAFQRARSEADEVFRNPDADQPAADRAAGSLKEALEQLEVRRGEPPKAGGSGHGAAQGSPKTGEPLPWTLAGALAALAVSGIVLRKKRR